MKITLNVRASAIKRGINTPYQLQKATGLSPSNASKLFNGKSLMISLDTLGRLCEGLACTPNDLLTVSREPEPTSSVNG